MNNNLNFDLELEKAVEKVCFHEYERINRNVESYQYSFSTDFIRKMNKVIKEEKKRQKKKRHLRIIFIAAIICILNTAIVVASDDLRENIGKMLIEFFDDRVHLKNEMEESTTETEFVKQPLIYLPEGYVMDFETENPASLYNAYYIKDTGDFIDYTQSIGDTSDINITYNGKKRKKEIIKGTTVWIISDGEVQSCIYEKGGYIYSISTTENEKELKKIVKKIN